MSTRHFLKAEETFPEMYRAFVEGELSVCMERFGGINEISLLDVVEADGKVYPDNHAMPIFSRKDVTVLDRHLFGAAIRLFSKDTDGRVFYHYPCNPELYPWGVSGATEKSAFEMLIDSKRIIFNCHYQEDRRNDFLISFSKHHLYNGEFSSIKNQRVTKSGLMQYERAGLVMNPSEPFPNGSARLTWEKPKLCDNKLLFHARIDFSYASKDLWLAATADVDLSLSEPPALWALSGKWAAKTEICAALALADTREEALHNAETGCQEFLRIRAAKFAKSTRLKEAAPKIDIENLPAARKFMDVAIDYQNAMLVGGGVGIRAAAYKYGFFAMWDAIYPIRDFLWNGQVDQAKKMLRYLISYPYMNSSPWMSTHLILTLNELLAYSDDAALVDYAWPYLKNFLEVSLKSTNPRTGLVLCHMNVGVDNPKELGLNGLYHASCINSWWYGALRVLENLALERGDLATTAAVRPIIELLETNYLKAFYAEKAGYLRTGVGEDMVPGKVEIYQNTSTIGMDYLHGQYLLRSVVKPLAAYQAKQLYHPLGRTAVSWDSEVCCEMWKCVHMNQHNGHEMKLARLADMAPEAYRVVGNYLEMFERYKTAIETFNLSGDHGNASQTADWQSHSATACGEAIRQGLIGIGRHRGGLYYIPADDHHAARMENVQVGDTTVDIRITGQGKYARMTVDGRALEGTMQIPVDMLPAGNVTWEIERSSTPGAAPTLLNAFDLPVRTFSSGKDQVAFTVGRAGRFPIKISALCPPAAYVNGSEIVGEWNGDDGTFWLDLQLAIDDVVKIALRQK